MESRGSHLLEIDEQFCQCPICLQQYKEPKLLPCIHRYCRNCIEQLIKKNEGANTINCPECRGEFAVPEEGVDGFKTDFYINNVIEYIQLQKSLEDEQLRECCDCLKMIRVTGYCFKCNDFLCKDCHNSHVTKKILKDHVQHTLSLEDMRSKSLTPKKLAVLKEAPRCHRHLENVSQLCCKTCNNCPICVTCTYGSHENHNIKDVNILANEEKEKLKDQIATLNQYKEKMYMVSQKVPRVQTELVSNVKERKEWYQTTYEMNVKKIEAEIKNMEDHARIQESEIKTKMDKDLMETQKQMEKELDEVKKKYDNICNKIRRESETKISDLKEKHNGSLQKNKEQLKCVEVNLQTFMSQIDRRHKELEKQLEEISLHIDGTAKRFENLAATASTILDTGNDWTAVQCIPDVLSASEPLSVEMKRDFPELEMMSQIEIVVTLNELSPVHIQGLGANKMVIDSITHSGDGSIVVSGHTSTNEYTFITVLSMDGKILQQKKLKDSDSYVFCCCRYLKLFKVVVVHWENEVGLYDVQYDSYNGKNISDMISSWQEEVRLISCVATDPGNNNIFLGSYFSKNVFVFDNKLNYLGTLGLPELLEYPRSITVSDGYLLVCDYKGSRAFAVGIDGVDSKVLHEFKKPISDGDKWGPLSVCTDKNQFVYMLWKRQVLSRERCLLVQYSRTGQMMLTPMPVDKDSKFITQVDTPQAEKLVIATSKSGKLLMYEIGKPRIL